MRAADILNTAVPALLAVWGWRPFFVIVFASGTVGASSPPGVGIFDCDRVGHGEDLGGGRHEQRLRDAVGPSFPGKQKRGITGGILSPSLAPLGI